MTHLNNNRVKRNFPEKLIWLQVGTMFPWPKRKFIRLGLFGHVFRFDFGSYKI